MPADGSGGREASSTSPDVDFQDLLPGTAYSVSVRAVSASGAVTPPSNSLVLRTPGLGAPAIRSATPISPSRARIEVVPPAEGGPYTLYRLRFCPANLAVACIESESADPISSAAELPQNTDLLVTASACSAAGVDTGMSAAVLLSMPPSSAPALTEVIAWGATTAQARATAPPSVKCTQVRGAWG